MDRPIETPVQGKEALMHWFIDTSKTDRAKVPEDVRTKLEAYISPGMSPVDACVHSAELIYARADDLPVELVTLAAALASMAASHGFHDMGERGPAIAATLMKRKGVSKPRAASGELKPPAPKELFAKQTASEPPPEPA